MFTIQAYAEQTARIMGVAIPPDFSTRFGDPSQPTSAVLQRSINAYLVAAPVTSHALKPNHIRGLRTLSESIMARGFKDYVAQLNSTRATCAQRMREYYASAANQANEIRGIEDTIRAIENTPPPIPLDTQVEQILEKTFLRPHPLEFTRNPGVLVFTTPSISLKNTLRGAKPRPMGEYKILFRPGQIHGCFTARKYRNNNIGESSGRIHPFFNNGHASESTICFGSAQPMVDDLLMKRNFVEAAILLQSLLTTYDANAYPYTQLEDWPTTLNHMCSICNVRKNQCNGCRNCGAGHGNCGCVTCKLDGCSVVTSPEYGGFCYDHQNTEQSGQGLNGQEEEEEEEEANFDLSDLEESENEDV